MNTLRLFLSFFILLVIINATNAQEENYITKDEIFPQMNDQNKNDAESSSSFKDYWWLSVFQSAYGGPLTTITFAEFPLGTIVTTQYSYLGAEFVDGNDKIISNIHFISDGVGIRGYGAVHLLLSQPALAIGAYLPGGMIIDLYDKPDGTLLYRSSYFGGVGSGYFGGVVTDKPFTYAVFWDWVDGKVALDDIFIGFAIIGYTADLTLKTLQLHFNNNEVGDDSYIANGTFILGEDSDGINLLSEDAIMKVGPSMITIPADSFWQEDTMYRYEGTINGVEVQAGFKEIALDSWAFGIRANYIDLTGTSNPDTFKLIIGNDWGEALERLEGCLYLKEGIIIDHNDLPINNGLHVYKIK